MAPSVLLSAHSPLPLSLQMGPDLIQGGNLPAQHTWFATLPSTLETARARKQTSTAWDFTYSTGLHIKHSSSCVLK